MDTIPRSHLSDAEPPAAMLATSSPSWSALGAPVVPPGRESSRFTLDGSEALEERLRQTCELALAGVERAVGTGQLEALLLGGGYGRGEGGVLKTAGGDLPYNDLEFYVFVSGNRLWNQRRYQRALQRLSHTLSAAGVEVEFKIASLAHWRRCPISMFSYDLMMGHRRLGRSLSGLTGCEHHCRGEDIPLAEVTRLLMNRFSGLLFAQAHLAQQPFTGEAADFVERNLAKAQLSLGDAVLAALGQYHWSCLERQERLRHLTFSELLPWRTALLGHHAAGVEFKLHPRRTGAGADVLQLRQAALTSLALRLWLWLENRRLNASFPTARAYSLSRANKCPETPGWRNFLVNGYTLFPNRLILSRCFRHPRERVLNALAWLLWELPSAQDGEGLRRVQAELTTCEKSPGELTRAYRRLWEQFR